MRESVLLVVGAVVAVVLQIVLAPNLVILGSMPDLVFSLRRHCRHAFAT